ncbi:hypothetical protein P643_61 [Klebsiella phage QL]|uniref:Uncharacterized protein n=1 Tax=Klebsiella phage QL TaxID=3062018 RepID=A0AAX4ASX0_9CAUD|nr:hypothetical protein P643_61 [Klebsiella phage QL]
MNYSPIEPKEASTFCKYLSLRAKRVSRANT